MTQSNLILVHDYTLVDIKQLLGLHFKHPITFVRGSVSGVHSLQCNAAEVMAILEPSILSITDASYYLFGHFTTFEIASVPLGLVHDIRFPRPASASLRSVL